MPNYIQYRWALRKQSKAQRQLNKSRPEETREAHESGALAYFYYQDEQLFAWKRLIQTDYYRRKADRLLVPMPSYDQENMYEKVAWDWDPKEPHYLTDEGLRVVREAVREEEKHRREAVGFWFGIVVGVIGSITGLVAVFKS